MPLRIPKRSLVAALFVAWGVLSPSIASAQGLYPNQSVKFVVAFSPGGPTDVVARILGQRLTEKWGQSVVIENRGGAGGNIAARQVAKAEPNGYTVLVTTSAFAVNPSLTTNAGYSPESDYRTVIVVGTTPNIIVAATNLKASTLQGTDRGGKNREVHLRHAGGRNHTAPVGREIFKVLANVRHPGRDLYRRGTNP